jgi:RNA polymerase sigma-70 factor (ECF subfamily)
MLLDQESLLDALPEALGLLALMLLHDSRRDARIGSDGEPLLLEEQDRALWDQEKKQEGLAVLEQALRMKKTGPYQIQAAISALHVQAERAEETDWPQIAALYGMLWRMAPSPIVELNRSVAVAMADGPLAGLALLDRSEMQHALAGYHLFHAVRADLLQRAGRLTEASSAYKQALTLCQNEHDRAYLHRRLAEVGEGVVRGTSEFP